MIEIGSFRAAHHQKLIVEHLRYQNDLLQKRNQALAQENAKLLEQLEQCLNKIQKCSLTNIERINRDQDELYQRAKRESATLFYGLDKKMQKKIGGLVMSYKQILEKKPSQMIMIYDYLTQIIAKILQEKDHEKQVQLKQMMSTAENRLLMRKNARNKASQVVHLIKQPPKQLQPQYRDLKYQMDQQSEIYQRLVRKIKKDNVNIHTLEQLYGEIQRLMSSRWKLKQEQAKLVILEREFQLGNFLPINQQTNSQAISQLSEKLRKSKTSINFIIQSL